MVESPSLHWLQFLHEIDSFFLINRGLIRQTMCISMLLVCTSKDGCTIERIVTAHMPVTLKRMVRAPCSTCQHSKLPTEQEDRAPWRIWVSSLVCVCVLFYFWQGKVGRREKVASFWGGKAQKRGQSSPQECACILGPLDGSCPISPLILDLDWPLWSTFPLSLTPALAFWALFVRFEGISYPFWALKTPTNSW